ncbi:MAG: metallophosphoesterase [Bacteroidetes bacterium]|nr:metallophosphoesterase [Bacteroidota bacterium]
MGKTSNSTYYPLRTYYWLIILFQLLILVPGCESNDPYCDPWDAYWENPDTMKFIATGDPQYKEDQIQYGHVTVRNSDWIAKLVQRRICEQGYLGYLIAGDLTFYARKPELEKYQTSIDSFKQYVFDGLGNHDFKFVPHEDSVGPRWRNFGMAPLFHVSKPFWTEDTYDVWEEVRSKARIPKVYDSKPNLHYSFDWDDLHIVQLNAFPGENPTNTKHAQHPFNSIQFLKEDLEKRVGNSDKPVILIHHYGFDDFSIGVEEGKHYQEKEWWTEEDRKTYWDVLKPYNVAAIFTGHAHKYEEWYLPWDGENIGETNVATDFIPTFVAGAAREGYYLDCILVNDTMTISRYNIDSLLDVRKIHVQRGKGK